MKSLLQAVAHRFGYQVTRIAYPPDFDPRTVEIVEQVRPFTMTTPEAIVGVVRSVEYIVRNRIPGALVECGVWRGGSMMAAALTLQQLGAQRDLYLFDTFEGMPPPTDQDVDRWGRRANDRLATSDKTADVWAIAPLTGVRQAMATTGYDAQRVHFVPGRVEDTLPGQAPDEIALLRIDVDWYEPTRHVLGQLYPRLAAGGALILDDYGDWQGARKAVDEYIEERQLRLNLIRLDHTVRIAMKLAGDTHA